MAYRLPAIRFNKRCTPVGRFSDGSKVEQVCDWTYDALIVSQPHYRLANGAWSGGGPFYAYHDSLIHRGEYVANSWYDWGQSKGPFRAKGVRIFGIDWSLPGASPWKPFQAEKERLLSYFPTAFARTRPGNPKASLGVFLSELRDLPRISGGSLFRTIPKGTPFTRYPSVLLDQLRKFMSLSPSAWKVAKGATYLGRTAGEEYLNLEFGWRPFISDLRKLYELQRSIDKEIDRLIRENGKWIRRRTTLENETSVTQDTLGGVRNYTLWAVVGGPGDNIWRDCTSDVRVTTVKTTRRWFSGSYRYWIPDIGSPQWTRRAKAALYGVLPTPKLVWDATPWTWLLDWFGNMGDIVSNLSLNAAGYPVLRWSFLMEETKTTVTATAKCWVKGNQPGAPGYQEWPGVDTTFSSTRTTVSRLRVEGSNPFGLGLPTFTWPELTPRQAAILVALGVTRR